MGGFIAAETAISHPSRVEKLVLVSAAGLVTVRARTSSPWPSASRPLFHLGAARTISRREHWVRRRGLRRMFLYGVARHPDRLQPELCFEVASGARQARASSTRSRRSSTTTSATGCRT